MRIFLVSVWWRLILMSDHLITSKQMQSLIFTSPHLRSVQDHSHSSVSTITYPRMKRKVFHNAVITMQGYVYLSWNFIVILASNDWCCSLSVIQKIQWQFWRNFLLVAVYSVSNLDFKNPASYRSRALKLKTCCFHRHSDAFPFECPSRARVFLLSIEIIA